VAVATSTIADIAQLALDRVQDPTGIFWQTDMEAYSAVAEAISELFLIIGRPTQQINTLVTLIPNVVWQPMPANLLTITNIQANGAWLKRTTLRAMDYTQAAWSSAWESDRGAVVKRWLPVGLKMFAVHPAPTVPVQVIVTGLQFPVIGTYPLSGAQQSPFHAEIDDALNLYAAYYMRQKEIGDDFLESKVLYTQFLQIAQRLTSIEERRDSLVWTQSFGAQTTPGLNGRR
jgi:hypothetical protein